MTVEEMIDEAAKEAFSEKVNRRMWVSGEDYVKWSQLNEDAQYKWRTIARDVLESLDIPLETLAALKAGTWKAVPVAPTDEMALPLTRLYWLLPEQDPTAEDMQHAGHFAAAVIAAAPAKPGEE
jgi:hypothetical protein